MQQLLEHGSSGPEPRSLEPRCDPLAAATHMNRATCALLPPQQGVMCMFGMP